MSTKKQKQGGRVYRTLETAPLLFFQTLWLLLVIFTGFSTVTSSMLAFHMRGEEI